MKSASTPYRTQIIEESLRQEYVRTVGEVAASVELAEAAAHSTEHMMVVMSQIDPLIGRLTEIHKMLGERCAGATKK